MRAIRVHEYGGPEAMRLEELPTPKPGDGQALVRIEAAGVNFIDVYQRTGLYKGPLPVPLGLEGAGVVEAVGAGRHDGRASATASRGRASRGRTRPTTSCRPTGSSRCPAGVDARAGAAAMLQGMTAHYLAHSTYPLKPGDTCLVHAAAGGVGLLLCQMAKRRGRAGHRHGLHRGEGEARARGGRRRRDPLHAAGLRGRGEAADRREGRPGRLRLGRQGHLREGLQLPRAARLHGALRRSRAGRSRRSTRRC